MRWMGKIAWAVTLAVALGAQAETLSGRVVAIADGDTLTVLDASRQTHKIRLAGIDAPEMSQAYGQVAKTHLSRQVFGREVVVDLHKTDRYGRWVGTVWFEGRDMNLGQLAAGLAWHFKAYANEQAVDERQRYADAESQARQRRDGLWRQKDPQPPWEYRQRRP